MKIALVHDYLNEFGGAERVLLALSEIWPEAPIYTSYYKKGSPAWEKFKNKDIRVSWAHYIPFWDKLLSPLRFLAPLIWGSFNFSKYDLIITSAGWYVTKGVGVFEICYCHTPPRYLYGYQTSINWQKYWPVRVYSAIVNHFMRLYDFKQAQKVNYFIANSENVKQRIKKFYRREAVVIYPPVDIVDGRGLKMEDGILKLEARRWIYPLSSNLKKLPSTFNHLSSNKDYFLIVSRIVGGKGLEMAIRAANKLKLRLKIVGEPGGYGREYQTIKKMAGKTVDFVGFVKDSELVELYRSAKGFLALAQDEDFGITPVEAMMAGTPVVAYRGGGYVESIVEGKSGLFFDDYSVDALVNALIQFDKLKFNRLAIAKYAQKFSKERFKKEIENFVQDKLTK